MFSCLWFSSTHEKHARKQAHYEATIWSYLFFKIISICFCFKGSGIFKASLITQFSVFERSRYQELCGMFMLLVLSLAILHSWISMSCSGNQRQRDFKWVQTKSLVQFFFVIVLKTSFVTKSSCPFTDPTKLLVYFSLHVTGWNSSNFLLSNSEITLLVCCGSRKLHTRMFWDSHKNVVNQLCVWKIRL